MVEHYIENKASDRSRKIRRSHPQWTESGKRSVCLGGWRKAGLSPENILSLEGAHSVEVSASHAMNPKEAFDLCPPLEPGGF